MGLYDRDYMRDEEPAYRRSRPAKPWSPTIVILVVLGVVFVLQTLLHLKGSIWLELHFALSLSGIRAGHLWEVVTFQFLHAGFLHLALNGMTLYSFGRFLEVEFGRGRFLALYFISGTAGGILQMIAAWLLRQPPEIPVVGASAGIAGVLGAFILSYPDMRLILFPIPFKIRAWNLLWILLPMSVIGTVYPFGGIAHAAHLGGLLAGGAFTRWAWKSRPTTPPPLFTAPPAPTRAEKAQEDFIASEVDPILDKIAKQGIHSLTERERKILETAKARMEKR